MKFGVALVVGAVLSLGAASNAGAVSFVTSLSDNFDTENGGSPQLNYYNFNNWTVGTSSHSASSSGGSVDLIGNGSFDAFPGNGLYVDMCGSTGACGSLTSKSAFAAGTYQYTITLGGIIYPPGNGYGAINDGVGVTFGGANIGSLATNYQSVVTYSGIVTVGNGAHLTIQDLALTGNENIGATLLSVNVSAVPLPAALPLFGAALSGVGLFGWRRSRKSRA